MKVCFYYRVCPWCGASLDPGEVCDCGGRKRLRLRVKGGEASK